MTVVRPPISFRAVVFALSSLAMVVALASAQDDTWRVDYPSFLDVVPPRAEQCPGSNTYWHDPNLTWRNRAACREFAPDEAGQMALWFVEAEGLFLFRDAKSSRAMARLGAGGPEVLGTGAFESEFEAGVRATVGRALSDWYRIEGTYFGSYTWNDSLAVRNLDANGSGGNGNLFSPFSNFGNPAAVPGLDNNDFAAISFSSQLDNVELNVRRRLISQPGRWESSFVVGVRYVDVSESFGYQTTSTTPGPSTASVDYQISTDNQLIGAQLGLTTQFLVRPRMWIDFDIKGGIYANNASMSYTLGQVDNTGTPTAFSGSDNRDRTSFLGEISLDYNYQFLPGWTFVAGYNAYWLTGLALAEENFNSDINLLQLGPTRLNHSGESVYHGPHLGLTWTY